MVSSVDGLAVAAAVVAVRGRRLFTPLCRTAADRIKHRTRLLRENGCGTRSLGDSLGLTDRGLSSIASQRFTRRAGRALSCRPDNWLFGRFASRYISTWPLLRCIFESLLSASYCPVTVPAHKRIQVIAVSQPNVFSHLSVLWEQGKARSLPKAGNVSSRISYARLLVVNASSP